MTFFVFFFRTQNFKPWSENTTKRNQEAVALLTNGSTPVAENSIKAKLAPKTPLPTTFNFDDSNFEDSPITNFDFKRIDYEESRESDCNFEKIDDEKITDEQQDPENSVQGCTFMN